MAHATRAVEIAWGDEDAALGKPVDGVSARLVPGRPQIQTCGRFIDPQPGAANGRRESLAAGAVTLPLGVHVMVVAERSGHRRLHRVRDHQARVFAHGQQLPDQRRVAGEETSAVARQIRRLGQRMDRQQTGQITVGDPGVEDRQRFVVPRQAQVALVRHHDRPALARPLDHLAEVLEPEDLPGGVRRRVQVQEGRRTRSELRERISANRLRTGKQGTDFIGGISDFGNHHLIARSDTQGRRQTGDDLFGPDHRQDHGLVETGNRVPARKSGHRGAADLECPDGHRVAGETRRLGQCRPDQRINRVHRRSHGEIDDAVAMLRRPGLRGREGVPGEIRKPPGNRFAATHHCHRAVSPRCSSEAAP